MPARLAFDLQFAARRPSARRSADRPMRILALGDFSAGAAPGWRTVAVDNDSFEPVLARMAPRLTLGAAAGAQQLTFRSLDDFHPDRLVQALPSLQRLHTLRQRLAQNAQFAAAAEELRSLLGTPAAPAASPAAPTSAPPAVLAAEDDAATMARLLGGPRPGGAAPAGTAPVAATGGLDALLRSIVAPHIVPEAPPNQATYLRAADAALAQGLRAVLHDPAFQALEASWRGLWWLLSELEVGTDLQLHLLDASLPALRADRAAAGDALQDAALYRCLVPQDAADGGDTGWSLVAVCHAFGPSEADLDLLGFLGAVASHAGGPAIATAAPALLGLQALANAPDPRQWPAPDPAGDALWQALRRSAVAPWIGLALPRVLLRLPYGARTDPTQLAQFEEIEGSPQAQQLLWGSAALACALLIGQGFLQHGWDAAPGTVQDLGGLPAYVYQQDGDRLLQPVAEILLSEPAADSLLARGLIPIAALRGQNAARVLRMQSVAAPPRPLAGGWREA